jgi:DNA-directed RNA polymerase subunit RPC12/RpoP
MKDMFACPNCGKLIDIQSPESAVECNHCGEALLVSPGSRVVLANPIRTYLAPDNSAEKSEHTRARFSVAPRPPISAQRRKRTAHLAYERVTQQEQLDHSGLVYGILAIVFGGFLGLLSWLRSEYVQSDWVGWAGLWIGALVLVAGTFVTTWFYRSLRSAQAAKREIEKEIKG